MTRAKIDLFKIYRNAMLRNTNAGRAEAYEQFWKDLKKDPRTFEALAEEYFYRQCASWTVEKLGSGYSLVGTPSTIRRGEHIRREKQKPDTNEFKTAIRKTVLFDIDLPNGKKLRESTFADCARAGGWLTEVSRHGKGTEAVDKKLTETDLQNIWKRYAEKRLSAVA